MLNLFPSSDNPSREGCDCVTGTIPPPLIQRFVDANGNAVANGNLYVYAAGGSTPATTYSDVGLTVPRTNPIVLDASGVLPATFLASSSYRFRLETSAGVMVFDRDNESSVPPSNVDVDVSGTAGEDLAAQDCVYLSDGSGGKTAGRWYKAKADNTYSSSDAFVIGLMPTALLTGVVGTVRVCGRMTGLAGLAAGAGYYISSVTAGALVNVAPTNRRLVGGADTATTLVLAQGPRATEVTGQLPLVGDTIGGRLTLTTGTPVTVADVTAAATLFYALYTSDKISLHDGATTWNIRTFAELSIAIPAATSQMYDVWIYDNAGTPAIELLAWTNDTTRATAITRQNGRLVKSGVTTRRYVGCVRSTTVASQTEDSLAKRYLWNYYYRLRRNVRVVEAADSWTYNTAAYRQMNGSAADQADVVIGVAEVALQLTVMGYVADGTANTSYAVSIGEDSSTVSVANVLGQSMTSTAGGVGAGNPVPISAYVNHYPAIGRHFYAALERGAGAAGTWYGDNAATTRWQSGISGWIEG